MGDYVVGPTGPYGETVLVKCKECRRGAPYAELINHKNGCSNE